ncbi:hypothetical protein JZ751_019468, partial [Albula glossodonta]
MPGHNWGYGEENGPCFWHKDYPIAQGDRQSPIDIIPSETVYDPCLPPLTISYECCTSINISNSGFSVVVEYDDAEQGPVDGKTYACELHLVHWNASKHQTFGEAAVAPDGLAVLGIFLEGSTANLKDLNPKCLLPKSLNYWTYLGSLTTPPLHESVTWIVFKEPIEVSEKQMEKFRMLLFSEEEEEEKCMENNFRPPQPLKGRK